MYENSHMLPPQRPTTLHPIVMTANAIKQLEFYRDDLEEPFWIFSKFGENSFEHS
jgi:hypothetical protein